MTWKLASTCAAFALVIATGGAAKADVVSDSGCFGVMSQAEVVEIAEGHMYIHMQTEWTGHVTEDRDSMLFGTAGTSYGSVEIEDGAVSGSGYVELMDVDGEASVLSWEATGFTEQGELRGTWALVGGEGKWDGAGGSGTWWSMPEALPDRYVNCWEGEFDLADS